MTEPGSAEPAVDEPLLGEPVVTGPGPAGSVSDEEALRRLERVADRLRVVGPRLAGREGPAAEGLLAQIRGCLQRLADLAATADGEPPRSVPCARGPGAGARARPVRPEPARCCPGAALGPGPGRCPAGIERGQPLDLNVTFSTVSSDQVHRVTNWCSRSATARAPGRIAQTRYQQQVSVRLQQCGHSHHG